MTSFKPLVGVVLSGIFVLSDSAKAQIKVFRPDTSPPIQAQHPARDDADLPASVPADDGKRENRAETAIYVPFIDFNGFDSELKEKITVAGPRPVEVSLYVAVTPNSLPERLEKWLAAVSDGGGQVRVVQASPGLAARSLGAGVGVVMQIVTIIKNFRSAAQDRAIARAVRDHDAELVLESSDSGDLVVRRVIFKRRNADE